MLDIKQKFSIINTPVFTNKMLVSLLAKLPEQYTLYDLTRKGVLAVIKKDEAYLNLCYKERFTPRILGASYCKDTPYMFGGMAVYNRYGFTTQLANQYLIYSSVYYGERRIYTVDFQFKKVDTALLYGMVPHVDRGITYQMMSKERAFIEFCRENKENVKGLKSLSTTLHLPALKRLLKRYPYQKVRDFISQIILQ